MHDHQYSKRALCVGDLDMEWYRMDKVSWSEKAKAGLV